MEKLFKHNDDIEIDLSVVIPCLNEEKTVGICVDKCNKVFEDLGIAGEVIVSDNGSTDNSVNIAQCRGAKVVHCKEKGYSNAVRFGFRNAKGKYILMGDADNTYDFLEIPKYWSVLDDTIDMVIGTRLKGHIEEGAMLFLHRYLGTPVLTTILNILYGTKISDIFCGMQLIKKESLRKLDLKTTGMDLVPELMIESAKNKFKMKEVKISLYNDEKDRKTHLNTWKDGWKTLCLLIKNRFN